jgi:dihydrodipicolinate synthase/N-acetylneuraminate lyase
MAATSSDWRGVFPAVMTQFKSNGSLDLDLTVSVLDRLIQAGVSGLIMLGTLGENTSLSPEEKREVLRAAVQTAAGRLPVLAGVAEYTTDLALAQCRRAAEAGCEGLMVLPCMVYCADRRETIVYFRTMAEQAPLPIMVYNNPIGYKVDITPDMFLELADAKRIVAIKESSTDTRRITDIFNLVGSRYQMFCGVDDIILEAIMLGCTGWVAGLVNAFPEEAVALFRAAVDGDYKRALELYRWFMPLLHLDTQLKLVQYIKFAMKLTGLGSEVVRPPRLPLAGEERERIQRIVSRAIETRPKLVSRDSDASRTHL